MGQFDTTHIPSGAVIDGRYRIVGALGEGGMGQLYRAEHVTIRRQVALKVLHKQLREEGDYSERMLREAIATGRVEHKNCVAITDSGALDDGTPYLVMELLKGKSLGDELDEKRVIPVPEAIEIVRQVLSALDYAHGVGVVHRDLKPENIFLVRESDGELLVKILDFGIAKLLESDGRADLTAAGMAIGSPTYMSPEQSTGKKVDGRADLYSLSVVFYEMICGDPPFYGEDKLLLLKQRMTEDPPPLPDPPTGPLPQGLRELIHSGLEREPDQRVPSAKAYRDALERISASAAMNAQPPPPSASMNAQPPPPSASMNAQAPPPSASMNAQAPPPSASMGAQAAPPPSASMRAQAAPRPSASMGGQAAPVRPSGARALPRNADAIRTQRFLMAIGGLVFLAVVVAIIASAGGDDEGDGDAEKIARSDEVLAMDPDVIAAERERSEIAVSAELDGLEAKVRAGKGGSVRKRLFAITREAPGNARAHYLLGLAYMEVRYWSDGFDSLRTAVRLDPELRDDEEMIKAALRSLTSASKPELGIRFLVEEVGEPAVPYLEETARGGSGRQRENAARALQKLKN